MQRDAARWAVSLDSQRLKGTIGLPDEATQPIAVQLDYLRLPAAEPKSVTTSLP